MHYIRKLRILAVGLGLIAVGCGDGSPSGTDPGDTHTVSVSMTGEVSIISDPVGIDCQSNMGTCTTEFPDRTNVALTATATTTAWMFRSWSAACLNPVCQFLLLDDQDVSVLFVDTTVTTPGFIYPVAGTGEDKFGGDGGHPTKADIWHPWGIAFDAGGAMYIGDTGNQRVRKIENGVITTVVGSGPGGFDGAGFEGDGGPATSALLDRPASVTFDKDGNLYIADSGNNRVRKVDVSGMITTVAGSGDAAFSGDGGPATAAGIGLPEGVLVDADGNLYVTDRENSRVRKVDINGIITTFAGNGALCDIGTGVCTGDGGPAVDATMSHPSGLALDDVGNLYISDRNNARAERSGMIRMVDTAGTITTFVSGLTDPSSLSFDSAGNLYVTERSAHRVSRVSPDGSVKPVAGTGESGDSSDWIRATGARLYFPIGLAIGPDGHLYISDTINQRVRMVRQ